MKDIDERSVGISEASIPVRLSNSKSQQVIDPFKAKVEYSSLNKEKIERMRSDDKKSLALS